MTILGLSTTHARGVIPLKADYIPEIAFEHILGALMPENRLALFVSLTTGLRIDDVLSLRRKDIEKQRFTIHEMKTGKARRVSISKELQEQLLYTSGRFYVFEHRTDPKQHRTRQAVYKDLKRACKLFRISETLQVSPHSARKIYAVSAYKRTAKIATVQKLLNHCNEPVTMIYAMADELTARHTKRSKLNLPGA